MTYWVQDSFCKRDFVNLLIIRSGTHKQKDQMLKFCQNVYDRVENNGAWIYRKCQNYSLFDQQY